MIISVAGFTAVAVAAAVTQQFGPVTPPDAAERIQHVNEAIDTLPYIHGSLVGVDSTPMAPAIRMLRPERLIQRSFTDTESHAPFGIVMVFSPDARDLAGHHPPVCYPNAGWTLLGATPITIPSGEHDIAAISYRFSRMPEGLASAQYTVATSFFIVPGNEQPFQSQMRAVEAAARDRRAAGLGAVHVMILLDGDPSEPERNALLARAGDVLSATIDRIAP
jgi:hypothetical protein